MTKYTIILAVFENLGFGRSQMIFTDERAYLNAIRETAELYDDRGIKYVLTIDKFADEAIFRG